MGAAIDGVITALEGLEASAQVTAIRAACEHLKISMPGGLPQSTAGSTSEVGTQPQQPPSPLPADIRTLKDTKNPSTSLEMACLVAYYLQDVAPAPERKDHVTVDDLDKYFKQAQFRLPRAIDQLPFNVKNAGYFDSAGSGAFKLNPVGYNLVVHSLPRNAQKSREHRTNRKSTVKRGAQHRKQA